MIEPWVYRFAAIILLVCGVGSRAFSQIEPYYKLPKDRTEKGTQTFPNLKAQFTKFYLRGEGGFLLQGNSLNADFNGQLIANNQVNITWGTALGYNYRDSWMAEIGYTQMPLQLGSSLRISPFSIPIFEQHNLQSVSVRFQQNVWVVDRIARSTRLFIGGGLLFNSNGKAKEVSNSSGLYLRQFSPSSPADTIRLAEITTLSRIPITGEISVELRGKLAEAIEIGVFAKALSSFNRPFRTAIFYQVNDASTQQAVHLISPVAFKLGVTVHYNFGIITKYESDFN